MASVAAERSMTGGGRNAAAQIAAVVRTETGAMVCAFLVLRLIASAHAPHTYPDTHTYETLNFFGAATRLWTVPLIWNLFPGSDLHVVAQIALGMFAWSALAISMSRALTSPWVRRVATPCVLMLGLVVQVTSWDSTLLSESISASLLVLEAALLIRLARGATRWVITGCLVVAVFWMFSRQVNVLLYLISLPVVIGFAVARLPRRTAVASVAAVLVLGVWGIFAITRDSPESNWVWESNALGIVVNRIATDPAALQYFVAHGLPQPLELTRERGDFLGAASSLARDGGFKEWIHDHFRATYIGYLLRHPRHALWEPLAQLPVLASAAQPLGKATGVLPEPMASTLWSTREGDIPFWSVVALALLLVANAGRARDRVLTLAVLLVAAGAVLAVISYDSAGTEPFRYFIPVGLLVRIGLLLTIALSAEALIARRKTLPPLPSTP